MVKRYGKITAYFLYNSSIGVLACPFFAIYSLVKGESSVVVLMLIMAAVFGLMLYLITKCINKRTPEEDRVATWWRAWWLGFRVAFKLSLCLTIVLIPFMLGWHLSVSDKDYSVSERHWYDERRRVRDEFNNEYTVGRSGDYIKDKSGNWQKVYKDSSGEPYINTSNGKNYLK